MIFGRIHVACVCMVWVGALGCSSSSPPAPEAYVDVNLSGSTCNQPGLLFSIGTTTPTFTPVASGNGVAISCGVHASGSGFDVSLNVTKGGSTLTASGHVAADDGTTAPGTLSASVSDGDYSLALSDPSCVLVYNHPYGPGDTEQSVSPGKIWGSLNCSALAEQGKFVTSGGVTAPLSCNGVVQFQFQSCSQ